MKPAAVVMAVILCAGGTTVLSWAGAGSPLGDHSSMRDVVQSEGRLLTSPIEPIATFDQYLRAFLSTYELGLPESDALAAATASVADAETWWMPRLSFTERLETSGHRADLNLSLDIRSSLFDSTAAPNADLARAELSFRQAVAAEARALAAAALFQDVAAYAVTAAAADVARAALLGSRSDSLPPPAVLGLRPEQRSHYEAYLRSLQGASYLEATAAEVRERLSFRLGIPAQDLTPPTIVETMAFARSLTKVLPDLAEDQPGEPVIRCLARAPAVLVAEAREAVRRRSLALEAAHDLSVMLAAGIDYGHTLAGDPGTTGANHGSAMVEVSARFVLPTGWPFAGSATTSAGTGGFSQELSVSWPPAGGRTQASDHTRSELEAERAAIGWDARALLRGVEQARAEKARRERALAWALLDASPGMSEAVAATLATDALGAGWDGLTFRAEAEIVQLRIEAAIGLLGEVTAAIELATHCGGLLPAGA